MKYLFYLFALCIIAGIIEKIVFWFHDINRKEKDNSNSYACSESKSTERNDLNKVNYTKVNYTVEIKYLGKKYLAIVENQKVFYLNGNLEREYIGSYKLEGKCYKVENRQGGIIGTIDKPDSSALISLSRVGVLEDYKCNLKRANENTTSKIPQEIMDKMYNDVVRKNKLIWLCAEAFENCILDIDTDEVIASSNSNDLVACAAGFTCLHYAKIYGSKFNEFYSSINY